jgi:pilus assembly protein TadC
VCLLAICWWALFRPLPRNFRGNLFPRAYGLLWLVLVVQNVMAQLITGPLTQWNEFAFNIYYVLLFLITAVIVVHYHERQRLDVVSLTAPAST